MYSAPVTVLVLPAYHTTHATEPTLDSVLWAHGARAGSCEEVHAADQPQTGALDVLLYHH